MVILALSSLLLRTFIKPPINKLSGQTSYRDRHDNLFEFLYDFNPSAAEKADPIIETKVENLLEHPLMGVERYIFRGRVLIIPEVSMIVAYWVDGDTIRIMRVLHQMQKFPQD